MPLKFKLFFLILALSLAPVVLILMIGGDSMIIVFFVIACIITGSFLISRSVTRPIAELTLAAKRLKGGDFSAIAKSESNDEIGMLATSWNEMVVRLEALYRGLENEVAARTEELEKFRQTVDALTEGVLITDLSGVILYVNAAWEALTGYTLEEVLGKDPGFLKSAKTPATVYKTLHRKVGAGEVFVTDNIVNKRKNGTEYAARVKVFPVRENRRNLFFVEIQEDISEPKKLEEFRKGFISTVSHQLRTPLASLRWFAEMLSESRDPAFSGDQKRLVGLIEEAAGNMAAIINMLLKIGRVETGRIAVRPSLQNIATIAEDVIRELEPQINARQIKVSIKQRDVIPDIPIDYEMMHEVISNLLSNAIWYSEPKKEVSIAISLKDDTIVYAVQDYGIGIPKDSQERIFELFFRAPNAMKSVPSGSGLGLALVKALVEKWEGKVWFESAPKLGTTFYFTIPKKGMKAVHGEVTLKT